MTDEDIEKIIKRNMTLQINLAGICADFEEALAQPKDQEPVAWMIWGKNNVPSLTFKKPSDKYVFDSLYITPPQRKPLTNDAARKLWSHIEGVTVSEAVMFLSVVRATEAAHGIKE